ncbi:MAG: tetratricopeptide repeat protein [Bacteroidota bacterium]
MKRFIVQTLLFSGLLQSCYRPNITVPGIPVVQEQGRVMSSSTSVPFEEHGHTHTDECQATAMEQPGPSEPNAVSSITEPLIHGNILPQQIKTAKDLVKAFNTSQACSQPLFQEWLQRYIRWFNEQSVPNLNPDVLHEYTQLAHIQLRSDSLQNVELLSDYIHSLLYIIPKTEYRIAPLMKALRYSLATVAPHVFRHMATREPEVYTKLASDLLNKIDPNNVLAFTKRNYIAYHNLFHILGQTLLLIHQLNAGDWNPDYERGLYQQFMQKLTSVEQSTSYYPFRYDACLLKQILQHVKIDKTFVERSQSRAMSGLKALVELSGCLTDSFPYINPDLGKLLNACGHIQEAFLPREGSSSAWYLHLIPLMRTATVILKDPDKYTDFAQSLAELKTCPPCLAREGDEQAFYFSVVRQLYRLALEGPTSTVRSQSINKLSELSEEEYSTHEEVMCELLDSLALLTQSTDPNRSGEAQKAQHVLQQLVAHANESMSQDLALHVHGRKTAIRNWLGDRTLDQKLSSILPPNLTPTLLGTTLRSSFSIIPQLRPSDILNNRQTNTLPSPPNVSFFVGRKQQIQQIQDCLQPQRDLATVVLAGPGGIGKTQLARKLFADQQGGSQYDHMFWIPAESKEKLLDAYLRIAEDLHLNTTTKKDSQQIVEIVRSYLGGKNAFYVFDDATDVSLLRAFLPISRGHVLITSRNSQRCSWDKNSKYVPLKPFSVEEAIDLAQQFDCAQTAQEQAAIRSFLNHMLCAPLTLVQLFSTHEDAGWDLPEFLTGLQLYEPTDLEQEIVHILERSPLPQVQYGSSMVYVLRQSIGQLPLKGEGTKSEGEFQGKAALQLLKQLSYLDTENIPVAWLHTWDPEHSRPSKSWIRTALPMLEKYSLIQRSFDRKQVYIHADTQLILRHLYLEDAAQVLRTTIDSLVRYVNDQNIIRQDKQIKSHLLPHGRMLFERLDKSQYPQEAYALTDYLTEVCRETCRFKESEKWARECLNLIKVLCPDQDHPKIAYDLNRVGASLKEVGDHKQALEYQQSALKIRERISSQDPDPDNAEKSEAVARSLSEVGGSLAQLGRYEEALGCKKQSLEIRQRLFGNQDHPEIAHSLNSVGELLTHSGQHEEALQYKQLALGVRQRFHNNSDHRDIARSLTGVGIGLEDLGKYQKALEAKQEALAMYQRLHKDQDHPDLGHALNNVGETLIKAGDPAVCNPAEGTQYCQQALDMRKRLYPDQDHLQIACSLHCVGLGSYKLGDVGDGLAYYCKEALSMVKRLFPDPERPHPYMKRMVKDLKKAMSSRDELIELFQEVLGEEHSLTQQLLSRESEAHV